MNKENWLLLFLFALLVSLIFGGIHIFLRLKLGKAYSPLLINLGIPSFVADETIAYAPKVREVFDGNLILTDNYLKEHKNLPSPLIGENLPAMLMAGLAKFTGSIPRAFILADFLLPPISLIFLTMLFFSLANNFSLSIFSSLTVIFFANTLQLIPFFPSMLRLLINQPRQGTYAELFKNFHPQVSFPIFLLFIFHFFYGFQKKKNCFFWISGILLGLLSYTYFFFSTYAFTLVILFFFYSLVKKDSFLTKNITILLVIGLGFSLPYLINLVSFSQLPQAKEFVLNFTYPPILAWKPIIFCLLAIFASQFARPKRAALFLTIFFLTGLLVLLSSYILKININDSPGHWAIRVIYPFGLVLFLLLVNQYLFPKKALLWLTLAFVLIVYQALCHYNYFSKNAHVFVMPGQEQEMIDWLGKTPKESVVLTASLKYNLLIPALTHNNVFLPYSQYSIAGQQEALERFFILYKFLEISPERINQMFSRTPENEALAKIKRFSYDDCAGNFFYYLRFQKRHNYFCDVPSEKLKEILEAYQKFNSPAARRIPPASALGDEPPPRRRRGSATPNEESPSLRAGGGFNLDQKNFFKYQADYLLIGPYEKKWAKFDLKDYSFLKLIKENNDFQLYQIKYETNY